MSAEDLSLSTLRLKIVEALSFALGDEKPLEALVGAVLAVLPAALVVGSTLSIAWVLGSVKWLLTV